MAFSNCLLNLKSSNVAPVDIGSKDTVYQFDMPHLFRAHSLMVAKKPGTKTFSRVLYSEIFPVIAVRKRWFALGKTFTVTSLFPAFFKASTIGFRFCSGET